MTTRDPAPKLLRATIFSVFLTWGLNLALHFGVREKSFLEKFWDILGGGGVGMACGIVVFAVLGGAGLAIGGAAISLGGIVGLSAIGAGLGLGVGGLVHVARNPHTYVFNWWIIIPIVLVTVAISLNISQRIADRLWLYFKACRATHQDGSQDAG